MARVSLDGKVWKDPRVKRLAKRQSMTVREVVGTLAAVWDVAYDNKSPEMPRVDVDTAADVDGFATDMVIEQLADELGDGCVMREPYQNAEIRRARTMAQLTGGRMAARDIEPWDEGGNITQARTWHRADASREAAFASRGLRADTRIRCTDCPAFIAFSAIVDADAIADVALRIGWSVDGAAYFCPDHQLVLAEYQQLVTDREVDPRYALDHAKYIEMAVRRRNPGGATAGQSSSVTNGGGGGNRSRLHVLQAPFGDAAPSRMPTTASAGEPARTEAVAKLATALAAAVLLGDLVDAKRLARQIQALTPGLAGSRPPGKKTRAA